MLHEQVFQSPLSTHLFVQRFLDELKSLPVGTERGSSGNRAVITHEIPAPSRSTLVGEGTRARISHEIPTPLGAVKVKVAGGVSRDNLTGVATAIVRDAGGRYL